MPQNLLDQLRQYTVVVADTGDIEAIGKFRPQDSTTNPSLITAAAQLPHYQPIVDGVLLEARKELGEGATDEAVANLAFKGLAIAFGKKILAIVPGRVSTEVDARLSYDTAATIAQARAIIAQYDSAGDAAIANLAFQRLAIAFAKKILAIVPGRVSTEVDARLSYDTAATIAQARSIIAQYDAEGIGRERILVKIASTWEGIRAAEVLEREGIHCNLTLLFGLHQAIAAAEAGVTLVSPFVGRILDWYKKETGKDFQGASDPGVISVTNVYNYYKKFGYKTQVMGASFRNIGEIRELAGCDLLTISPQLLAELEATVGELPRKLSPEAARALPLEKITVDKAAFDRLHAEDHMATDKLKEGIEGFSAALVKLETLLARRLAELEATTA